MRNALGFLYPSWMENALVFSLDLDFKTLNFGVEVICEFSVTL